MYLSQYSSYIFETDLEKLDKLGFTVLNELQCKANLIIKDGTYTSSLLSTAIQVDTIIIIVWKCKISMLYK